MPMRIIEINDIDGGNALVIQGEVIVQDLVPFLELESVAALGGSDFPKLLDQGRRSIPRILLNRKARILAGNHV